MAKYRFDLLGADRFEGCVQSLLERMYRVQGRLIQFGDGPDGAREATWDQPINHPLWVRPENERKDVPKRWVFQVKYHDVGLRGWSTARNEIRRQLDHELDKIVNKYKVPCHKYVLATNIPFTGVRSTGTRDRVGTIAERWRSKIPEIEVWDAADISAMLDADPDTRTSYLGEILPGDILRGLLHEVEYKNSNTGAAFHAYLSSILNLERDAKTEEAGDDTSLKLERVFIDLDLIFRRSISEPDDPEMDMISDEYFDRVPASSALLRTSHSSIVIKGGPGTGKSTLTQFLALYHAARIVDPDLAELLTRRLKLHDLASKEEIDAQSKIRFPFRVELRRYAQWISEQEQDNTFLARYLIERVNSNASSELRMDDLFRLAERNPVLLMLDGLDEVPNPNIRTTIFKELRTFLGRCGDAADICTILSSRPQGYYSEFSEFNAVEWETAELDEADFKDYVEQWLCDRVPNVEQRNEALERVSDGTRSPAVKELAKTLLQVTVMLTIARRGHQIPHARLQLFSKYVDVIFDRERNKKTVREHENELLRLHERIGYELLKKMESGKGSRSIGPEEFRDYILRIINDFGTRELDGKSIRDVVDQIEMLARDRLCFLAGKGESQNEFDFVIQSFREYFAACYFHKHESADIDHVFQSLVARSHFWNNTLKFYAAQQTHAQQNSWIMEMDGKERNMKKLGDLLYLVTLRRTMVGLLPEFGVPKSETVVRAVQNLYDEKTLWTWSDKLRSDKDLQAFSVNAKNRLEEMFLTENTKNGCPINILDLLSRMDSEPARNELRRLFQTDARRRDEVFRIGLRDGIPLDITPFSEKTIMELFLKKGNHYENTPIGFDMASQLIDVNCIGNPKFDSQDENRNDRRQLRETFLYLDNPFISTLDRSFHLPPLVAGRTQSIPDTSKYLQQCNYKISNYIGSVLETIERPLNSRIARRVRSNLPKYVTNPLWHPAWQIGPDPRDFTNLKDWKIVIRSLAGKQDGFLHNKKVYQANWAVLLFPPSCWEGLSRVTRSKKNRTAFDELRKTLNYFPDKWIFVEVDRAPTKVRIPLFELCDMALEAASTHNGERIGHEWLNFIKTFDQFKFRIPRSRENDELFDRYKSLRKFGTKGDASFNLAFLVLFSIRKRFSESRLLYIWNRLRMEVREEQYTIGFETKSISPQEGLVDAKDLRNLLASESEGSFTLVCYLSAFAKDNRLKKYLAETLITQLQEKPLPKNIIELYWLTYRLPIQAQEAILLSDFNLMNRLINHKRCGVGPLLKRIEEYQKPKFYIAMSEADLQSLRKGLGDLSQSKRFPEELRRTSLDTLLFLNQRIDKPIQDLDWMN